MTEKSQRHQARNILNFDLTMPNLWDDRAISLARQMIRRTGTGILREIHAEKQVYTTNSGWKLAQFKGTFTIDPQTSREWTSAGPTGTGFERPNLSAYYDCDEIAEYAREARSNGSDVVKMERGVNKC